MNRIKMIRIERNIKGCELARRANVTSAYLSMIENGRVPSRRVKNRIAKALCLPVKGLWLKHEL